MSRIAIQLNGAPLELDDPATVTDLLQQAGWQDRPVAVEVNRAIIPRSEHADYRLQSGDRVEIVHAIGGG